MGSLHTLNDIQTAASGPSRKSASYRDAQFWKDIIAETGFASYADYVEYYGDFWLEFGLGRIGYREMPESEDDMPADKQHRTTIYDLSIQENSLPKLSLRRYCNSGTDLIQALRKPPDGVCVQLVLWFHTELPLNQEMTDTLVLGLKLDIDGLRCRRPWSYAPKKFARQVKSIFGEETVAAISDTFMPDVANVVPVVLVASSACEFNYWDDHSLKALGDGNEKPPILRSRR